jgi:hypothetical protein
MEGTFFWHIKIQFIPHRRHITSPLQSPAGQRYVIFEVFTAVTMKNAVFWDVTVALTRATRRNILEGGILQSYMNEKVAAPVYKSKIIGHRNPLR